MWHLFYAHLTERGCPPTRVNPIESTHKFERIKAQAGWDAHYNKAEWWHFQYTLDKQPTFLDEMELIGYSETALRKAGWTTDAMLDHAPG
jgi:hypothetical protein